MMISLGGSRAGTGDAGVWRQFMQGRMTQSALAELQKVGLVDASAKWKHGRVENMLQHLVGGREMSTNMVDWARDVGIPTLNRGIDPNDKLAMGTKIGNFSSTAVSLGFLSEMILGIRGIDKEAGKIGNTTQNPMGVLGAYDPSVKLTEYKAAENELMVTLGNAAMGPALESLKALTNVLRELTDWSKAHPDAAKDLTLIAGGLSVLAKAAGDPAMVVFLGAPLIKGLGALASALSPFGAGGAAEVALTAAETLIRRLVGLFSGLGVLFGVLSPNTSIDPHERETIDRLFPGRLQTPAAPGAPEGPVPGTGPRGLPPAPTVPSYNPSDHQLGIAPNIRRESYEPAAQNRYLQPINVSLMLDSRVVARAMTEHIVQGLNAPYSGTTIPHFRSSAGPFGLPVSSV